MRRPSTDVWLAIAGVLVLTVHAVDARIAEAGGDVQVDACEMKAAFTFTFAKFAEWPDKAPGDPIDICVLDDAGVASSLARLTRNQVIGVRPVRVREVAVPRQQPCDVLYVSQHSAEADRVAARPIGSGTLTVSDDAGFAARGGMIELFVEGDYMRFAINVTTVQQTQVKLSSRLLSLAKIVKGNRGG